MTNVSYEVLEAHDRRMVAIHECGHAVVARHLGLTVFPRIWRAKIDNPALVPEKEKIWNGRLEILDGEETQSTLCRVCMAGVFAERIALNGAMHKFGEAQLHDLMEVATGEAGEYGEPEDWSSTDWQHARHWTAGDVKAVYTILIRNWDALMREAEDLIEMGKNAPAAFRIPSDLLRKGVPPGEAVS